MGSYKDAIIQPLPNKGNNKKNNVVNEEINDEKAKMEKKVDAYIKMLYEDPSLERRKDTLNHFNELNGDYKSDTYAKIYEIYIKFKDDESKKDLMQIRILNIIEKAYKNQVKEIIQKENEKLCLANGHTWDKEWTKTNSGWVKKCSVCNKKKTKTIDPYKALEEQQNNKGPQRKKRRF